MTMNRNYSEWQLRTLKNRLDALLKAIYLEEIHQVIERMLLILNLSPPQIFVQQPVQQ